METSPDMFSWLVEKEAALAKELLHDPHFAATMFRWVGDEVRAVVLHALCLPDGSPLPSAAADIFAANKRRMSDACRLGIFVESNGRWSLHSGFRRALLAHAEVGGKVRRHKPRISVGGAAAAAGPADQRQVLGTPDGVTQWEAVLKLLLTEDTRAPLASQYVELLVKGGFLERDAQGNVAKSEQGFQLLVQPHHEQVWRLVEVYATVAVRDFGQQVDPKAKRQLKATLVLLLASLPFHDPAAWYPASGSAERHLKRLAGFGLVEFDTALGQYRVSQLGQALAAPPTEPHSSQVVDGSLIVETNNRVYAYTSDRFKITMLRLFAEVELETEGMTVARLTRDSLSAAFARRMTAKQIVAYLRQNAHPAMTDLPGTVVDAIFSWEAEKRRIEASEAVMLKGPESQILQLHASARAIDPNGILHHSPGRLVVTAGLRRLMR